MSSPGISDEAAIILVPRDKGGQIDLVMILIRSHNLETVVEYALLYIH